ncbi:MAG: hypothetical protein HZA17_00690 [Nitrospirae bacterium]|nr:hypothetical protein [Nitrospirota bacterium]
MKRHNADDGILDTVIAIAKSAYRVDDIPRIKHVKNDLLRLFAGDYADYQGCDTFYHDLEHTIQVINPFAQIIDGWNKSGKQPAISSRNFELGLVAVMLHDTGYIKLTGDNDGTGGKYTFVHIERSISFARAYLSASGFAQEEITSVCNMIRCTGVDDRADIIAFSSEEERICGYALATADFIGQMAAKNYISKLPHLYQEFREGYEYEGLEKLREKGSFIFESAEALMQNTPFFYDTVVQSKFREMGYLGEYIKYHMPDKEDYYTTAIENNLARLRSQLAKKKAD